MSKSKEKQPNIVNSKASEKAKLAACLKLKAKSKSKECRILEQKNHDALAKIPKKPDNPFGVDTPEAHEELKKIKSMEDMIARGFISKGPAYGYFYYGKSDAFLWDKKEKLITDATEKITLAIGILKKQKEELETALRKLPITKKNKAKIKKLEQKLKQKLEDTIRKIKEKETELANYTKRLTASKAARENVLKAKSPDYAGTGYRDMIKKTLDTWIPKVKGTYFEKFMREMNDPDLYHALHVQEIMPYRYDDPKNKRIQLTNTARVHMFRLFTLYKDPTKMPAVNDAVASFGIGQTTLDTHTGLQKLDIAKSLELPAFEKCTTFDLQMRRDIINLANNLNHFHRDVISKHKNLEKLIDKASQRELGVFFATILGAMHNGGANCMKPPEEKIGKKLDKAKNLAQVADLLLGNLSKKSKKAKSYGQHVRGIYAALVPGKTSIKK